MAKVAKSANDILLAILSNASVIASGPDDLRLASWRRSREPSSAAGRWE
jgi:hypothetical protein